MVCDKTGTLTCGTPSLSELRCVLCAGLPYWEEPRLLEAVASVEMLSPHVLAEAVVQAARKAGMPIQPASDVEESPGVGISGLVEHRRIAIGSGRYMRERGVLLTETIEAEREELKEGGQSIAYISLDGLLVGMLIFEDRYDRRPRRRCCVCKGWGLPEPQC